MKTLEINSKTDLNNITNKTAAITGAPANPVTVDNKTEKFVAGNPVNKDSAKPAEPVKETPKAEADKPTEPAKVVPIVETAKPAEPLKEEAKKVVLNLEGTLKFIDEKYRLMKQRSKLQETIKNLDGFEVELRDEADTTDTNYYNGCVLTIQDDKRNTFETKNPTIIWTVAQLVNNMCVEKLAEIEAGIVLP